MDRLLLKSDAYDIKNLPAKNKKTGVRVETYPGFKKIK